MKQVGFTVLIFKFDLVFCAWNFLAMKMKYQYIWRIFAVDYFLEIIQSQSLFLVAYTLGGFEF